MLFAKPLVDFIVLISTLVTLTTITDLSIDAYSTSPPVRVTTGTLDGVEFADPCKDIPIRLVVLNRTGSLKVRNSSSLCKSKVKNCSTGGVMSDS